MGLARADEALHISKQVTQRLAGPETRDQPHRFILRGLLQPLDEFEDRLQPVFVGGVFWGANGLPQAMEGGFGIYIGPAAQAAEETLVADQPGRADVGIPVVGVSAFYPLAQTSVAARTLPVTLGVVLKLVHSREERLQ